MSSYKLSRNDNAIHANSNGSVPQNINNISDPPIERVKLAKGADGNYTMRKQVVTSSVHRPRLPSFQDLFRRSSKSDEDPSSEKGSKSSRKGSHSNTKSPIRVLTHKKSQIESGTQLDTGTDAHVDYPNSSKKTAIGAIAYQRSLIASRTQSYGGSDDCHVDHYPKTQEMPVSLVSSLEDIDNLHVPSSRSEPVSGINSVVSLPLPRTLNDRGERMNSHRGQNNDPAAAAAHAWEVQAIPRYPLDPSPRSARRTSYHKERPEQHDESRYRHNEQSKDYLSNKHIRDKLTKVETTSRFETVSRTSRITVTSKEGHHRSHIPKNERTSLSSSSSSESRSQPSSRLPSPSSPLPRLIPPPPPPPRRKQPQEKLLSPVMSAPKHPTHNECDEGDDPEFARISAMLSRNISRSAARRIYDEQVKDGMEVQWSDIAGLAVAKQALKESTVYPLLRPDLFFGLREPSQGVLLFGPPGTGKTMLARAVATESKSSFFAVSASTLCGMWLGESEKLVAALFALAKVMAPSVIFIDEIDSILSSRSSQGHETMNRVKTEFLIQWSSLNKDTPPPNESKKKTSGSGSSKGANGPKIGDKSRQVLVLAATNTPWSLDGAAIRRFSRRQYIPLPEWEGRKAHISRLLKSHEHYMSKDDIEELVELTEGYSGSDITQLARAAAMTPLRMMGDSLLKVRAKDIPKLSLSHFKASLETVKASVPPDSLNRYSAWAKSYAEKGV